MFKEQCTYSPRSRHEARRTHGWKHGKSIALYRPSRPPGAESFNSKSGTPDVCAVNTMLPFTRAESARPDGASVHCRFSRISQYSSLDVCRTLLRRQGIAVALLLCAPLAPDPSPCCALLRALPPRVTDGTVLTEMSTESSAI